MTNAKPTQHSHRTIGLLGATILGVGAIVGGGILALAGVAFTSRRAQRDTRFRVERSYVLGSGWGRT